METTSSAIQQTACQVRHVRYSLSSLPCPRCHQPAPRRWETARTAVDVDLDQPVLLLVTVSVHRCPVCRHYCRAQPPFLRPDASYTNRVVHLAVQSVSRDGMAISRVRQRLAADFWVRPSETMLRVWCRAAVAQLDFVQDYQPWVVSSFSGILCVDEVYQGEVALLLAVDPAAPDGDRLVGYQLQQGAVRQEEVLAFLERLRAVGITPDEVITDQSALYPAVLAAVWPTAAHQLCLFHVTRHVIRAALHTVQALRASLPEPPPPVALPREPLSGTGPDHPSRPDLRGYHLDRSDADDARTLARAQAMALVHGLRTQGLSDRAITRQTGFNRRTVRKWLALPCPEAVAALPAPGVAAEPTTAPPVGWESWEQVRAVREALVRERFRLMRRPDHLDAGDWDRLDPLFASPIGPALRDVRGFVTDWYALWRDEAGKRRSLDDARERYRRWRTQPAYRAWPSLRRYLDRVSEEQFTHLSQFLRHPAWECTNDGAERMGRTFRHEQAPHFYMRTIPGIEGAIVAQAFARKAAHSAPSGMPPQRSTRGRHPKHQQEAA
jgi:hypothetical protein